MPRVAFPTPYAGTYYPLYNSGVNQYIPPTPDMPFDKVSAIFAAFAHAYPVTGTNGAALQLEQGQPDEPARLSGLVSFARKANPRIKILISLGWGTNDWTYISADFTNNVNNFPSSVVALIRQYQLDGFDIDDESINGSSGSISQSDFDAVIQNLRKALDSAGAADGKPYYLTITPADGSGQVDSANMDCFDLINAQCYGGSYPSNFTGLGYPLSQIAWGIDTEGCSPNFPRRSDDNRLAGGLSHAGRRHPLGEDFVPILERPSGDHSVDDERIAGDELLRRLAVGEHAQRPFERIGERSGHQEHSPRVEFAQAGAVTGDVGLRLGHAVRRDLVVHDDFHQASSPRVIRRLRWAASRRASR
jgi:hypothetical protein